MKKAPLLDEERGFLPSVARRRGRRRRAADQKWKLALTLTERGAPGV